MQLPVWCSLDSIRASGALDLGSNPSTGVVRNSFFSFEKREKVPSESKREKEGYCDAVPRIQMKLEEIRFEEPANGYFPREDSWLLGKSVQECAQEIRGKKTLDMGCGSGIQTAALLLAGAREVTCADLNPHALKTAKKMVDSHFPDANVNYVQSDLFASLSFHYDVIVFNPPYVPSDKIKWIETDGGKHGRQIIDAFLEKLPEHLNPKGICLLLQTSLNGMERTKTKLKKMGLHHSIIARQKLDFEELWVWKITRTTNSL